MKISVDTVHQTDDIDIIINRLSIEHNRIKMSRSSYKHNIGATKRKEKEKKEQGKLNCPIWTPILFALILPVKDNAEGVCSNLFLNPGKQPTMLRRNTPEKQSNTEKKER